MIPSKPRTKAQSAAATDAKAAERLSAALRDNLKRRKAQQRAREQGAAETTASASAADCGKDD